MNIDYRYYDVIDSTNNEAKRITASEDIAAPLALVARMQTAGRGRQGKSFYSPSDTGIYMTVIIPLNCPIKGQVGITTAAAVAVAKAIEDICVVKPSIKWVNDIYLDDRKCCGILAEAVNDYEQGIIRYAIVGVGVNLTTDDYPTEIADVATGILKEADTDLRDRLIRGIADNLVEAVSSRGSDENTEYYISHSNVIGRYIRYTEDGNVKTAFAIGIDDEGGLAVADSDGYRILNSGEISVRVDHDKN